MIDYKGNRPVWKGKAEDLLTKVKKKIQKFKQHKNGAPKQATLHLKFQMVAVRR